MISNLFEDNFYKFKTIIMTFHCSVKYVPGILYRVSDTCAKLQRRPDTATFSAGTTVLANFKVDSLNACVGACTSVVSCMAVAIETSVKEGKTAGRCILGGPGFATVMNPRFYVYTVHTC